MPFLCSVKYMQIQAKKLSKYDQKTIIFDPGFLYIFSYDKVLKFWNAESFIKILKNELKRLKTIIFKFSCSFGQM